MGLTPLNGLPGATRSGTVDPSLIFHYTNKAGRVTHDPNMAIQLHVTQVRFVNNQPSLIYLSSYKAEHILNTQSGWKSLTGTTDFGLITSRAKLDEPDAAQPTAERLAFDLFADRILNYIGSYHLKLNGEVDAIVFSGGIGEKSKELRKFIGERIKCLGYAVDEEKNAKVDENEDVVVGIGVPVEGGGKHILVCRTDEQVGLSTLYFNAEC